MRFTEFKNIVLIESQTAGINDLTASRSISELDTIIAASSQLPPEAESIKSKIATNLIAVKEKIAATIQKLMSTGQAVVKEPEPVEQPEEPEEVEQPAPVAQEPIEPVEQPIQQKPVAEQVQGDIEYDALIASCEELKQQIAEIEALTMPEKVKAQLLATIKKSLDSNLKLLEKYTTVVDELKISNQKLKAAEDFINNVNDLLVTLGNKVQGYVEVSPQEYQTASAKAKKDI